MNFNGKIKEYTIKTVIIHEQCDKINSGLDNNLLKNQGKTI